VISILSLAGVLFAAGETVAPLENPCASARAQYEALALEEALQTASDGLVSGRPLPCLEVKALVHLVLNQMEEAKATLVELFERAPDHRVEDPSLSPAMKEAIDEIQASLEPLAARVSARWLVHESLRIDVLLEGGLRDATKVRYRTEAAPASEVREGEVALAGRAATATVAVSAGAQVGQLRVSGQVLSREGRVLHQFSAEMLIPARPLANERVVEVDSGPVLWPLWVGLAAVIVGAGITVAILAPPDVPDGVDLGRRNLE
jgi:hypothetical protein